MTHDDKCGCSDTARVLAPDDRRIGTGPHPLDPLSAEEILAVTALVRDDPATGSDTRFETIVLDEPTPEELDAFAAGTPCERRAFASAYGTDDGSVSEIIVSLSKRRLLRRTPRFNVRPRFAEDELMLADRVVREDPDFIAALRKRGITDFSLVCADAWSTSVLGDPLEADHRMAHMFVWVRNAEFDNQYAHPVEGLNALVDVNRGRVLRIDDRDDVPIERRPLNYASRFQKSWRTDVKPIEIVQPDGPSFEVDGNEVTWCGWRMRLGFTPREGLVLHKIELRDGDRWRSVARRMSLAEMIVPYGSPNGPHVRKNAFDCGEYGIGALANSLKLGCDCLGAIRYFDATINRMDGSPKLIENAVCMHEEDTGIVWKHTDFRTSEVDVRRGRRLVLSFIATVGNYDYAFYWHFYIDGTIELEVKLTGILFTSGTHPGVGDPHGTMVAPNVVAHLHQHIFSVRLDMEVDGPDNSVVEVDTEMDPVGPDNPFGNAIRLSQTLLQTTKAACRDADPDRWRYWTIVNRGRRNRVGEPVGFRLMPQHAIRPIGLENSQIAQRGGFTRHALWVTPTSAEERWPAGDYVNQSAGGEGLPKWVEADKPITDRRITVWHTFGHHHVPRPEDFPVQPVQRCGFTLQPFGFFDANPTLDVPPNRSSHSCCA